MNIDEPPSGPLKKKKAGKKKLMPEDVAEDNPQLAEFLRQRRKAEARMNDAAEIDFYLCLVFQSEKQKDEFLDNLPGQVDVLYNMYVDGESLSQVLGIKVTPNTQGPFQSPLNKRLTARTGIPDQNSDSIGDQYWEIG